MKKTLIILLLLIAIPAYATVRSFDATDDEVDMGVVLNATTTDVSVCAWVLLTEDASADVIVGKKNGLGFDTAGYMLYQDSSDVIKFQACDSSAGVECAEASGTTDIDGGWHFICGTHGFVAETSRIYVDGVQEGISEQAAMGSSLTNAVEFAVGEDGAEASDLNGLVAYVHQYNGVLTLQQVQELMRRPGSVVATQTSTVTAATNGGTFADDSAVGTITWSNPSNATSSDDSRATATMILAETSHYLKVTNFGFAIPADSVIGRIYVEFEAQSTVLNSIDDSRISIVKADGTVGTSNLAIATDWPTTDTYRAYDSTEANFLWGETWTPADINDADFGVVISAVDILGAAVAGVDHVRITIFYTTGTAGTLGGYWPMYGGDSPETDLSANGFDGTVSNASTNAGGPPVMVGTEAL